MTGEGPAGALRSLPLGMRLLLALVGLAGLIAAGLLLAGALGGDDGGSTATATSVSEPTTPATGDVPPRESTTTVARTATTEVTVAPTTTAPAGSGMAVPQGMWGGSGIQLTVTAGGGSVEYECASGVIAEPLVTDDGGNFEASGSHAFERGGPVQPNTPPAPSQPARFAGWTDGSQMRLSVTLTDSGTELGPFTLHLGQQASLDRCV